MVIVLETHDAVTPEGKPVAVPIPDAPVVECVISVKDEFTHIVGVELPEPKVFNGAVVNVKLFAEIHPLLFTFTV